MSSLLKNIVQRLYPYGVFRMGEAVYLTFDDGPIPEVTPKVLEILKQYDVKGTFFMVGENIDKHPEVFRQVVEAGHAVGNHTYNHLKGWKYSTKDYMANVMKCAETITNHQLPITNLFRPPYGKATPRQRIALHRLGYSLIYWDILTQDYNADISADHMLRQIQREVRPGSIINFHDSLKSNERMLEALPRVIEWLKMNGYKLEKLNTEN